MDKNRLRMFQDKIWQTHASSKNVFRYFMNDVYSWAHKKFINHDLESLQGTVFKPKVSSDCHKKSKIHTKFYFHVCFYHKIL